MQVATYTTIQIGNNKEKCFRPEAQVLVLAIEGDAALVQFDGLRGPMIGRAFNGQCSNACYVARIEEFYGTRQKFFESMGFPGLTPEKACGFGASTLAPEVWKAIDPWSVA